MRQVEIPIAGENTVYRIQVGAGLFNVGTPIFANAFNLTENSPQKIALLSDKKVDSLYGDQVRSVIEASGVACVSWQMPEGEDQKSFAQLENALSFLADNSLRRTDAVVSLGGGVVGDLAGLAASLYLRGIGFVQVPTTLLSMVDSSVGGKTGINLPAGKNLVGAFYEPKAVFVDVHFLKTLEVRDLRAGYYELVKHGAIGGTGLLESTSAFISQYPLERFTDFFGEPEFEEALISLIAAQIRQKAAVISEDRTEDPNRSDPRSRKILNFGHTIGHALEQVTEYRYFRHGEAVAWGMLTAMEIARMLEICDQNSIKLLNDVVRSVGPLPDASKIDIDLILNALESDKKQSPDTLQWVLIEAIGRPRIESGRTVTDSVVRESLSSILQE